MIIAICQQEIKFENKELNLKNICTNITKAKNKNADIVFFPEMSLTGFSMNIEKTSEKNSFNIQKIKDTAIKEKISVGFGWVKYIDDKAENHYTVVSDTGEVISDYIKIHPFSYAGEDRFFYSGEKVVDFKINDVNFSTFICYDLRFPEIFQIASKKSDVIVIPANWPEKRKEHWKTLLKARAIENQCYIIGVNCFGYQYEIYYSGDSCVLNPNGDIIIEAKEKEDLLFFELQNDTEKYRKDFPIKKDRKNELYKKLM